MRIVAVVRYCLIILSHAKVNNSLFQSPIFFSHFLKIVELHKILHVFLCTLILAFL